MKKSTNNHWKSLFKFNSLLSLFELFEKGPFICKMKKFVSKKFRWTKIKWKKNELPDYFLLILAEKSRERFLAVVKSKWIQSESIKKNLNINFKLPYCCVLLSWGLASKYSYPFSRRLGRQKLKRYLWKQRWSFSKITRVQACLVEMYWEILLIVDWILMSPYQWYVWPLWWQRGKRPFEWNGVLLFWTRSGCMWGHHASPSHV